MKSVNKKQSHVTLKTQPHLHNSIITEHLQFERKYQIETEANTKFFRFDRYLRIET